MTESLTLPSPGPEGQPVTAEDAVSACIDAFTRARLAARQSNRGPIAAGDIAAEAYCRALPRLSSPENIRAFIACVAHGLAMAIIEGPRASRLLYAAQVAKSALDPLASINKRIAKIPNASAS